LISNAPEKCEIVFRIRDVSKIYKMGEIEIHALRKVNLELFKGELAVLLGASGSGKSTLLNIIGGLDTPTAVITHNAPIARMADRVIRIGSGEITSIEKNAAKAKPSDLIW
jgi:ABC-type lipoprotein export system ATPase subunit